MIGGLVIYIVVVVIEGEFVLMRRGWGIQRYNFSTVGIEIARSTFMEISRPSHQALKPRNPVSFLVPRWYSNRRKSGEDVVNC